MLSANIVQLSFIFIVIIVQQSNADLPVVPDDELTDLIRNEAYVITLFASKKCEPCDQFEKTITDIQEELATSLFDAKIVKVIDSQLTRLYSPTKEPILVFFRHGVPLLYHGQINGELILHTFLNNKEPIVKELTDDTFEHLTQAASGATTGDWFVMFYTSDCVDCHRLQARWEAVGSQLKSRMNIARINKGTTGVSTARRFEVATAPSFILFRHGKMYRYQIQKYDISSFISFAQDWYKNMKPERVPVPQSPFDEFLNKVVKGLQQNPWLWQISFLAIALGFLMSLFLKSKRDKITDQSGKQKSKKSKEEKEQ